jgi:spore coat polysaccharide biosynthesis predicted glycosyltransferase SpsG
MGRHPCRNIRWGRRPFFMLEEAGVRLFYRADGSAEIGTGHLLRGIRIAAELSRRGDHPLTFCVRAHPWAVACARRAGLEVVELPFDLPIAEEPQRCVQAARRLGCDAAAVDLLDTPAEPDLCGALRAAGLRVVTFDNTGPGRLAAHAVINFLVRDPAPGAVAARGGSLYEGPEYATLLPEYAGRDQQPKMIRPRAERLLVTMGGGDAAGLAVKVVRALQPDPPLSVSVVVGSAFPHMEALQAAASASPHTVRVEDALPSLLPEWEMADMAVVAGGLTMHEALVTGTPAIAVCQEVWHQPFLARLFAAQGVMVDLGLGRDLSEDAIGAAVAELAGDPARREQISRGGQRLSDGRGTERVADVLLG